MRVYAEREQLAGQWFVRAAQRQMLSEYFIACRYVL
jgi:hypothetical protein